LLRLVLAAAVDEVALLDPVCMFSMWRTCTGPLNTSLASEPAKPFSLVRNGTLCQAEKLSSCVHVCQPVVNGHACPDALSLAIAATTSGHVWAPVGIEPRLLERVLVVPEHGRRAVERKDSIWPLGFV
jgi:hypothetical protein